VQEIENLITTNGRRWTLQKLIGASAATFATIQLGSSSTAPTKTDTGVTTLVCTLPVSITDNILTSDKFTVTATIPQALYIGTTFRECALMLSDATCFNHSVTPDFTKDAQQVDVEWDIIWS